MSSEPVDLGEIPWRPIANVYVLTDGTYIVRGTRVITREIATTKPASEGADPRAAYVQEEDEEEAVDAHELKPYRVVESAVEHCTTPEAVAAAVERAGDAFFQQSRHGGNLLGILGPAEVFKGQGDG